MTTHFKASGGNRANPLCNIPIDPFDRWSTDPANVDCPACKSGMPNSYEQPKQMNTWMVSFLNQFGGGESYIDADRVSFERDFVAFRRSGELYRAILSARIREIVLVEEDMK